MQSARGAHGGYWLSRPAEEIAMVDVVQALEGAIAPMECFVHDHTERVLCSHEPDAGRGCATKLLWTRVQAGLFGRSRPRRWQSSSSSRVATSANPHASETYERKWICQS